MKTSNIFIVTLLKMHGIECSVNSVNDRFVEFEIKDPEKAKELIKKHYEDKLTITSSSFEKEFTNLKDYLRLITK